MKLTQDSINQLKEEFNEVGYYNTILDKIRENVDQNPDIAIECCKSLIEGISKFILKKIDNSYINKEVNKLDVGPLLKKCLKKMSEFNSNIEEDLINRLVSVIHHIGEVRNARGDVSHGKLAPKEIESDSLYSNFVVQISDSIIYYMLSNLDLILNKISIKYNENNDYNEFLDLKYDFDGKVSYSQALFDQDYISYEAGLDEYNENI